jgi:magnesium chelatase family protein
MLVAAMNPCPCGYYNHPDKDCVCAPGVVQKYLNKMSGPLLDRIDIHIEVTPVPFTELSAVSERPTEKSADMRERVMRARRVQEQRYVGKKIHCNAQMGSKELREICRIDATGQALLEKAMDRFGLSARAYDRILKVARTIADLVEARTSAPSISRRPSSTAAWTARDGLAERRS